MYTNIYVCYMLACTFYILAFVHIQGLYISGFLGERYVCVFYLLLYTYVRSYVCMHVHIIICIRRYVCITLYIIYTVHIVCI